MWLPVIAVGLLLLSGKKQRTPDQPPDRPTGPDDSDTPHVPPQMKQEAAVADAAKQADAAFGGALGIAGTALGASFPVTLPYIGSSGVVVGAAWASLSKQDKAKVWWGDLS